MSKRIYLDHAAATPLRPEVLAAMKPFYTKEFANPNSIHSFGEDSKIAVESARLSISKMLNCNLNELVFTSSGSESINLAIQGVARAHGKGHIITCRSEHAATLRTCEWLEAQGFQVTYLAPDSTGMLLAKEVESAIQENTILISLVYANNEVGTINPIKPIAKVATRNKIPFHVDACQAANYLSIDCKDLGVDLMTLNSSKTYGPKGVALLYIKEGVKIKPLIFGGKQERSLRAGTLNVSGIVGFAKALELAELEKEEESRRIEGLRDKFQENIISSIPDSYFNGHKTKRLPNNFNFSFLGVDAETLVLALSAQGIFISNGSACSAGEIKSSYVLEAMGFDEYRCRTAVRISSGRDTSEEDLDHVAMTIIRTVKSLRSVAGTKY